MTTTGYVITCPNCGKTTTATPLYENPDPGRLRIDLHIHCDCTPTPTVLTRPAIP